MTFEKSAIVVENHFFLKSELMDPMVGPLGVKYNVSDPLLCNRKFAFLAFQKKYPKFEYDFCGIP